MQEQEFSLKFEVPEMLCKNHHAAKLLCCEPQCHNSALVCRKQSCQCLPAHHADCQFVYTESLIRHITEKKQNLTPEIQKAVQKVDSVYMDAIQKLSRDRDSLAKWRQNYGLNPDQVLLIDLMRQNHPQKITGHLVHTVKKGINDQVETTWLTEDWATNFWKRQKTEFHRVFANLNKFHKNYLLDPTQKKQNERISSLITEDLWTLKGFFQKPVAEFKLLYRASQHQFSVTEFHKRCDGVPHTLTLAQTQFGRIVGGYTPLTWKSTPGSQIEADKQKQSFLFSLDLGQKYPLQNVNIAIANNRTRGPMFGQGRDLCISDLANQKKDSFCNFPYSYNNGSYVNNQHAHTSLTGNPKGYYFLLKDWEVFEVVWGDS